jgi:hypothetical protein
MERVDYESLLVSELLQDRKSDGLDVSPWYQRRSVWNPAQKAYLLNTLFERKPIPSIYVRHVIDLDNEKSVKEIVDGQQRIRSILEYRDGGFAAKHPSHDNRAVKYEDLTKPEKQSFLSSKLSVGYLIDADDSDVIEIFGRINSISKTLNPQERRNAQYSGEFKQFCLRKSVELVPFWRESRLFSDNDISRMLEVQVVSDLVYNMIEGLKDFSAFALSKTYAKYDAEFPMRAHIEQRWDKVFRLAVEVGPDLFKRTIFSSYQNAQSLFFYVDEKRAEPWTAKRLRTLMDAVDNQIGDFLLGAELTEGNRAILESFRGGNLHRIRSRRQRDNFLSQVSQRI